MNKFSENFNNNLNYYYNTYNIPSIINKNFDIENLSVNRIKLIAKHLLLNDCDKDYLILKTILSEYVSDIDFNKLTIIDEVYLYSQIISNNFLTDLTLYKSCDHCKSPIDYIKLDYNIIKQSKLKNISVTINDDKTKKPLFKFGIPYGIFVTSTELVDFDKNIELFMHGIFINDMYYDLCSYSTEDKTKIVNSCRINPKMYSKQLKDSIYNLYIDYNILCKFCKEPNSCKISLFHTRKLIFEYIKNVYKDIISKEVFLIRTAKMSSVISDFKDVSYMDFNFYYNEIKNDIIAELKEKKKGKKK